MGGEAGDFAVHAVGFALGSGAGQGVAAEVGQGGVGHQHGMGGQMGRRRRFSVPLRR